MHNALPCQHPLYIIFRQLCLSGTNLNKAHREIPLRSLYHLMASLLKSLDLQARHMEQRLCKSTVGLIREALASGEVWYLFASAVDKTGRCGSIT